MSKDSTGFEQIELDIRWNKVLKLVSTNFGSITEVSEVVFLIGIQELGMDFRSFSKDEKIDIMHVGICSILMPYGYYEFVGKDENNWPHFDVVEKLPALSEDEMDRLMKQAIAEYFKL
jgi:hypothetical protein